MQGSDLKVVNFMSLSALQVHEKDETRRLKPTLNSLKRLKINIFAFDIFTQSELSHVSMQLVTSKTTALFP